MTLSPDRRKAAKRKDRSDFSVQWPKKVVGLALDQEAWRRPTLRQAQFALFLSSLFTHNPPSKHVAFQGASAHVVCFQENFKMRDGAI